MQQYVLGIDLGTGSTKAVAIDFNGQPLNISQHYYPVKTPQPGYVEQDPELILEAFYSCVADTVAKLGCGPQAISFSSAMHSLIPVDENGKALADMLTWADARSEAYAEKLRFSADGPSIYRTSGTPVYAMSPLSKLMWMRENQSELFGKAHKFIGIKEYIWFRLFGEFEVDYSIASASGLFDIKNLHWNPRALELAGITAGKLSKPVDTVFNRAGINAGAAKLLNIDPETPCVAGAGDGCCANLGSFVLTPDVASLTIGTSGAVRVTSPVPVYNDEAMIFNYMLDSQTFCSGGAVNNGGIALQWLIGTFLNKPRPGHAEYDEVFKQAATVPAGSDGLLFLPYINGERAPLWDTKASGTYFGIRLAHSQAHFLRAGIEGICYALHDVLQIIEQSSVPVKQVNISGGFISSPLWTQILADILGKELVIVQQEDASALGAIFLAARSLDLPQSIMQPPVGEKVVIQPDIEAHAIYQKQFARFKKLYKQLKGLMDDTHDV